MAELIGRLFWLPSMLVGHPQRIVVISILIGVCAVLGQTSPWRSSRRFGLLWIAAAAWALYAAWEGLLTTTSPNADIRIDLVLIWPVLFFGTLIVMIRALRRVDPELRPSLTAPARRR